MKKGLLYYCLVLSVIFHLVLVAFIRLDQIKKKEKEPVVIDLVGPLTQGPKTVLPSGSGKKEPPFARKEEKAPTRMARIMPFIRPSVPSIPTPAPSAPSRPSAPPAPSPAAPGSAAAPSSAPAEAKAGGPPAGPAARPSPPSAASAGRYSPPSQARPEGGYEPHRPLIGLNEQELAKIEREAEPRKKDDTVTLDTDDLMYTAYLQGLKRRIELIWKYPETARRDGLQGSLVMRFTIEKSGKVEKQNIELVKSSGYPMLDEAAKQALIDASPFNPLPDNWKKDSFTITGTFIYRLYGMYLR